MKRFITTILICIITIHVANSQDTAKLSVRYKLTYVIDTTQPEMPDIAFFTLYQAKNTSKYVDYIDESSGAVYATIISGQPLFKNFTTNKLIREIPLGQTLYAITDDLPNVEWKLVNEQKKILGYPCQKATGYFKGRQYIAWFSPKLPYRNGPWKLGGLPGLILEMYDEKKTIIWESQNISLNPVPNGGLILPSKYAIAITSEKFKKVSDALLKNPSAMAGASTTVAMPPGVRSVSAVPHGSTGPVAKKRRTFNNPIELDSQ